MKYKKNNLHPPAPNGFNAATPWSFSLSRFPGFFFTTRLYIAETAAYVNEQQTCGESIASMSSLVRMVVGADKLFDSSVSCTRNEDSSMKHK